MDSYFFGKLRMPQDITTTGTIATITTVTIRLGVLPSDRLCKDFYLD